MEVAILQTSSSILEFDVYYIRPQNKTKILGYDCIALNALIICSYNSLKEKDEDLVLDFYHQSDRWTIRDSLTFSSDQSLKDRKYM